MMDYFLGLLRVCSLKVLTLFLCENALLVLVFFACVILSGILGRWKSVRPLGWHDIFVMMMDEVVCEERQNFDLVFSCACMVRFSLMVNCSSLGRDFWYFS